MNYFLWFTLKGVNKPQSVYLKKLLDTMDEPGTNDIKKKLIWPWSRVEHGQSGNNSPWFICAIIVLLSANLHRFEVFFIINYNTSTWSDWSNYRQEWDLLRSLKKIPQGYGTSRYQIISDRLELKYPYPSWTGANLDKNIWTAWFDLIYVRGIASIGSTYLDGWRFWSFPLKDCVLISLWSEDISQSREWKTGQHH